MKILIKGLKQKNFQGDEGEDIKYGWYVGVNVATGFALKFGSSDLSHEKGKEYEIDLLEDTNSQGKKILKELVVKED